MACSTSVNAQHSTSTLLALLPRLPLVSFTTVAGLGANAHKIANDVRLLSNFKKVEEDIEAREIGSSAMASKHNPVRFFVSDFPDLFKGSSFAIFSELS